MNYEPLPSFIDLQPDHPHWKNLLLRRQSSYILVKTLSWGACSYRHPLPAASTPFRTTFPVASTAGMFLTPSLPVVLPLPSPPRRVSGRMGSSPPPTLPKKHLPSHCFPSPTNVSFANLNTSGTSVIRACGDTPYDPSVLGITLCGHSPPPSLPPDAPSTTHSTAPHF